MNITPEWVLQLVLAIGSSGLIGGVFTYFLTKPKVRAETAAIATTTATEATDKLIRQLTTENERLGKRVGALETDAETDRAERHLTDQWVWRLRAWAMRAYDELHRLGSTIEAPPERNQP